MAELKVPDEATSAAIMAIDRGARIDELKKQAAELDQWAESERRPLPQGNWDIEAREAADARADGLDMAADQLRERIEELEARDG